MREKRTVMDVFWWFVLIAWSVTILFPLFWIFYQSLKTNQEFFQGVWAFAEQIQWMNYTKAWLDYGIAQSMLNTLYYVGAALILGVTTTAMFAYVMTRMEFKGRKLIWGLVMLSLFLPGINALIPQYVLMRSMGLTNSLSGLVLLDGLGESVFFLMLLSGFMMSLPKELEESASMDGASIFQIFFRIIVPLSTPGIITITIFKFLGLYNNFLGPFIYLSDQSKYTIGVTMYEANKLMQYRADWVTLFAGVTIAMVPTLLMYMFFQRWIMEGATLGAVKG